VALRSRIRIDIPETPLRESRNETAGMRNVIAKRVSQRRYKFYALPPRVLLSLSPPCRRCAWPKGRRAGRSVTSPNIPRRVTISFLLFPLVPSPLLSARTHASPSRRINDQSHPATFISRNRSRLAGLASPRLCLPSLSRPLVSSLRRGTSSSGRRGGLLRDVNFAS